MATAGVVNPPRPPRRLVLAGFALGAGLGSVVGPILAVLIGLGPAALDLEVPVELGVLVVLFAAGLVGGFLGLVAGSLTGLVAGIVLAWLLGRGMAISRAAWGSALLSCWIPLVFGFVVGRTFGLHAVVTGVVAAVASLGATLLFSRLIARSEGWSQRRSPPAG
ncbi:MAG: hypothetical protein KY434_06195 [Actinobacteria bacterium]|nr:hypothetical protein [Actinomycetota bacterium]